MGWTEGLCVYMPAKLGARLKAFDGGPTTGEVFPQSLFSRHQLRVLSSRASSPPQDYVETPS